MKSKVVYLAIMAAVLLCGLGLTLADQETGAPRYHQHREAASEADLGPCQVCGGEGALCTHLPILSIETGGKDIPGAAILDESYAVVGYETGENGEEMIPAALSVVDQEGVWHHGDDQPSLTADMQIRCRGNTSRAFAKHGYLLKLTAAGDPLQDREASLLGMSADSEWALHGPFLDKTLLRNYMWMNISAQVMGYAPDVRFCELLLNGEYQGVYVLMETISEGAGRVDLTDYDPGAPVCSYIVRIGAHLNPVKTIQPFTVYTYRQESGRSFEVLYPGTLRQTQQVQDYICADLSQIEQLLYSSDMVNGAGEYQDVLDVDSFVDYYVLQEFLAVNDAFFESTYFYRDVRGKLHIGPVWDYNNVLDNFFWPMPTDAFLLSQRSWYGQLMRDEDFVERVIARYKQLRQGVLSEAYLNDYMDETVAWLGGAIQRNYQVWGYTFDPIQLPPAQRRLPTSGSGMTLADVNPASHAQAVEWMRTYMEERGAWLDTHIDTLLQYCRESKNAGQVLE